jgi:hypothetical protein
MRAKFVGPNVFPFHDVAVGHFDKLTKLTPMGVLLAMVPPSAVSSYSNAYSSYLGTPLGTRHVIAIRN